MLKTYMPSPFAYLHKNIFKQPYRLLPLAVFTFYGFCFLFHPLSPLRTGQFSDPDDYMRLNEVLNWFQNPHGFLGGWFDVSQPRMAPHAGTVIHWSRLVDLPIAFVMLPFLLWVSLTSAAMIASWIVPPLLFGVMLGLVRSLAVPFVGKERANLATPLLLFAPALLFNFTPGRVDHHAYQILIAGFGIVALQKMLTSRAGWIYGLAAAATFACGLWIGTEALPWLLFFLLCLGLGSVLKGGFVTRNSLIFSGVFFVSTLLVLFAALPPSEFCSRALSWYSSAFVVLAALNMLIFFLFWSLDDLAASRYLRLAFMALLACCALTIFIGFVPTVLQGPFADYDAFNATVALDNISEAKPLAHAFWIDRTNLLTWQRALNTFIHSLFLPLVALGAVATQLRSRRAKMQSLWLTQGVFLLGATVLTLFWQVRVGYFMELFSLAPLTWVLVRSWEMCGKRFKNRPRFWAEIGVFCLLGPLPVLLLPNLFDGKALYRDIVLFPAARGESNCNLKPAAEFLAQTYPDAGLTIMTGMNEGPELLFRTPFNVIGGNYNVAGNPDVLAFFHAQDDATAQNILRKWNAKLVLTCRNIPPFFAGLDHAQLGRSVFLRPQQDGKLHLVSSPDRPTLIEKLVNHEPPQWLKTIEIPGGGDYLLYEVEGRGSASGIQHSGVTKTDFP